MEHDKVTDVVCACMNGVFSVCADLCGWPGGHVYYINVFVCVHIEKMCSALLLVGPGHGAESALPLLGYLVQQSLTAV